MKLRRFLNLRGLFVLAVVGWIITWITGWKLLLIPHAVFWLIVYWIVFRTAYRLVRGVLDAAGTLVTVVREQRT